MSAVFFGTVKIVTGGNLVVKEDGASTTTSATPIEDANLVVGDRVMLVRADSGRRVYALGKAVRSQTDWVGLNYAANVADYTTSSYDAGAYKKTNGIVHLRGLITVTVAIANDGALFTMPVGYRITPSGTTGGGRYYFGDRFQSGSGTPMRMYMDSSGVVRYGAIVGGQTIAINQNFDLGGICYPADS